MTPHQIKLVQTSFSHVAPIATIAADLFYGRLFEIAPQVRRLFPEDLREQIPVIGGEEMPFAYGDLQPVAATCDGAKKPGEVECTPGS